MNSIDLRSDTVTLPTQEMRDSILTAQCGDDVFGDDPTTNKLQQYASELLNKESSLFFPSGTMANQVALMVYASSKGQEILCAQNSHLYQSETGGIPMLSGAQVRFFSVDNTTGYIDPQSIENKIRTQTFEVFPKTVAIVIENPSSQGKVISIENMKEIQKIAKKYQIQVHFDASRLFNACESLSISAAELASYCDSLMFCLSKGLCAPVGSILVGSKDFIAHSRRYRKMIGGTMRQVGVIAAPGLIALEKMPQHIKEDHRIVSKIFESIQTIKQLNIVPTDINMCFVYMNSQHFKPLQLFLQQRNIKITIPQDPKSPVRLVTHYYIRDEQVEEIVNAFKDYFKNQNYE